MLSGEEDLMKYFVTNPHKYMNIYKTTKKMTYIYQQAKVVPHTAKKEEVAHQKKNLQCTQLD